MAAGGGAWVDRCRFALVAGTLCVLAACANEEATRISREDRRQFHVVMESKLRQIDRGIALLGQSATPGDSTYEGNVAALKQRQNALRERLIILSAATDEEWMVQRDSVEFDYHGELVRACGGCLGVRRR
jgi:hypothetical protein